MIKFPAMYDHDLDKFSYLTNFSTSKANIHDLHDRDIEPIKLKSHDQIMKPTTKVMDLFSNSEETANAAKYFNIHEKYKNAELDSNSNYNKKEYTNFNKMDLDSDLETFIDQEFETKKRKNRKIEFSLEKYKVERQISDYFDTVRVNEYSIAKNKYKDQDPKLQSQKNIKLSNINHQLKKVDKYSYGLFDNNKASCITKKKDDEQLQDYIDLT